MLILPFESSPINDNNVSENVISRLYYSTLTTRIPIGIPSQEISFVINSTTPYFTMPLAYPKSNSSSFSRSFYTSKIDKDKEVFTCKEKFFLTGKSEENLTLNLTEDLNFYQYKNEIKKEEYQKLFGVIGLQIPTEDDENYFIRKLKDKNVIGSYIWSLNFTSDKEIKGNLIIGKYPHDYKKDSFERRNFIEVTAKEREGKVKWNFDLTKVYLNSTNTKKVTELTNSREIQLVPESHLNYGTEELLKNIKELFFDKYIAENKCFKNDFLDFFYFSCKINDIDKKSFPELWFSHDEFRQNFTLNFDDLFIEETNSKEIVVMNMLFKSHPSSSFPPSPFIFGLSFLKKYNFSFDFDKRILGFYKPSKPPRRPIEINNKFLTKLAVLALLYISILLMLLVWLVKKQGKNKREIEHAVELEEEFRGKLGIGVGEGVEEGRMEG